VDSQQQGKGEPIQAAVEDCVRGALKAEKPFRFVNDYLLSLRRAKWPEDSLLAVQSGVLRSLKMFRDSGRKL
jgi:hypothetical protein